jgi:hypothetical protein
MDMDDKMNESTPAVDAGQEKFMTLGMWLGRHQAFGLIANQCSAGDAECLKIIRENEEYKKLGLGRNLPARRWLGERRRNRGQWRNNPNQSREPPENPGGRAGHADQRGTESGPAAEGGHGAQADRRIFSEVRAIAETSAQRAELIVLLDQARGQLTSLIEEVGRPQSSCGDGAAAL